MNWRFARPTPRNSASEAVLASISGYVAELRHSVRTENPFGGVRNDLIEQIRRDFAAGTFGGEADLDRAVDALIKEL